MHYIKQNDLPSLRNTSKVTSDEAGCVFYYLVDLHKPSYKIHRVSLIALNTRVAQFIHRVLWGRLAYRTLPRDTQIRFEKHRSVYLLQSLSCISEGGGTYSVSHYWVTSRFGTCHGCRLQTHHRGSAFGLGDVVIAYSDCNLIWVGGQCRRLSWRLSRGCWPISSERYWIYEPYTSVATIRRALYVHILNGEYLKDALSAYPSSTTNQIYGPHNGTLFASNDFRLDFPISKRNNQRWELGLSPLVSILQVQIWAELAALQSRPIQPLYLASHSIPQLSQILSLLHPIERTLTHLLRRAGPATIVEDISQFKELETLGLNLDIALSLLPQPRLEVIG